MRRVLPLLVVLPLLAGCLEPPPAASAPPDPSDGFQVTAIRVEPHRTPFDLSGRLETRPCILQDDTACPGPSPYLHTPVARLAWNATSRSVVDPEALFWRADLVLAWSTSDPMVASVELRVEALAACPSADCRAPRLVQRSSGPSPVRIEHGEYFLLEGETGLRVSFFPSDNPGTTVGPLAVDYHLEGAVEAFVAASPPINLTLSQAP
jgi:hypothetical protein